MNPNLHTHTPPLGTVDILLHAHMPPVLLQPLPRLDDHVPHQLATAHERGAECLCAGPRLGAAAVEVDAADAGGDEG